MPAHPEAFSKPFPRCFLAHSIPYGPGPGPDHCDISDPLAWKHGFGFRSSQGWVSLSLFLSQEDAMPSLASMPLDLPYSYLCSWTFEFPGQKEVGGVP